METNRITNREFSGKDILFRKQCEAVNLPITIRQASKYRRKMGKAYKGASREDLLEIMSKIKGK